jgi:hypothetical protein
MGLCFAENHLKDDDRLSLAAHHITSGIRREDSGPGGGPLAEPMFRIQNKRRDRFPVVVISAAAHGQTGRQQARLRLS